MTPDWLFVVLAGLLGAHLAMLAYLFRRGGTAVGARASEGEEYVTDDAVYCPDCSTENEHGYKFCRECLAELPTSVSFVRGRSDPRDRRTT